MHPDFDLPSKGRIDGRTSSITAAFFQAITPVIPPSDSDVEEALVVLGMGAGNCRCAYCGDPRTEWDHFRPIVKGRQPTGFITEIANLVPACGKCNQSKGNKNWKEWMLSAAARSPRQRGVPDITQRMARLEAYESWRRPVCIDYSEIIGPERWLRYMGLPLQNVEGYKSSSAINFAEGLRGHLLIVHGSGDDNVHYSGTELLLNRLIELGKPVDFMEYPSRTHSISHCRGTTYHLYSLLLRYLEQHIPAGPLNS